MWPFQFLLFASNCVALVYCANALDNAETPRYQIMWYTVGMITFIANIITMLVLIKR